MGTGFREIESIERKIPGLVRQMKDLLERPDHLGLPTMMQKSRRDENFLLFSRFPLLHGEFIYSCNLYRSA